jgi:hypothetical protein
MNRLSGSQAICPNEEATDGEGQRREEEEGWLCLCYGESFKWKNIFGIGNIGGKKHSLHKPMKVPKQKKLQKYFIGILLKRHFLFQIQANFVFINPL